MCCDQLCLILWDPWTLAHQAPLSMKLSRQEYWNGLQFATPGDLLTQGSNPYLLCFLHSHADTLPLHHRETFQDHFSYCLVKIIKLWKKYKWSTPNSFCDFEYSDMFIGKRTSDIFCLLTLRRYIGKTMLLMKILIYPFNQKNDSFVIIYLHRG